ncbi:uncharacterized protein LOC134531233 isoform X2 [Bacillus rossius redtenbacheri]
MSFTCAQCRVNPTAPSSTRFASAPRPFRGQDHEDPVQAVHQWEQALRAHAIHPTEWVDRIGPVLLGEASRWWNNHEGLYDTWEEFTGGFLNHFGNQSRLAKLTAQLYGTKQKEGEDVESFLLQKRKLYKRLHPGRDPNEFLPTLLELVRPNLRPFLRHPPPENFSELMVRATTVQRDCLETRGTVTSKPCSPSTLVQEYATPNKRLPKCWHCPEQHFHKDCPVLRCKQSERNSLNTVDPWRERVVPTSPTPTPKVENLNSQARLESRPTPSLMCVQHHPQQELPRVKVQLDSQPIQALIDSAATTNFVHESIVQRTGTPIKSQPQMAQLATQGSTMTLLGNAVVQCCIADVEMEIPCLVAKDLREELVLHQDWLTQQQATLVISADHRLAFPDIALTYFSLNKYPWCFVSIRASSHLFTIC